LAAAIWSGENDDPWAAYIPLLVGAAVTLVAGVVAVRDPGRRRERVPLWLSVASGALLLVGTVWAIAGGESGPYGVPLVLALMLVPLIAALAFGARRFERSPERVRAPLNVRFKRGWTEANKSWHVVWRNRGLLWLPFTSLLLGTAGWIGGYLLAGVWVERTMPRFALTGFITLLPMTMLGTFLGTAFLAALDRRLDGERTSAVDGLRIAWRRRRTIAAWALLAAGFGAIVQALQQVKSEWALAPLVSALAGVAWGVLTVFVLPVLALEDLGLRDSVRRAAGLVKERWGESVAGVGNLTIIGAIVGTVVGLAVAIAVAIAAPDRDAMTTILVASFVVFMLMVSAIGVAGQVLSLALYRHATGRPARPFTETELNDALVPRRKIWRLRG
jgi:hypothetical protein